jgi:hypothetical protein
MVVWMLKYDWPPIIPARNASKADAVVPPLAETKAGFQLLAKVILKVLSNVPDVTFNGKPINDGTCVATPAVPVSGTIVQQWICAIVVGVVRPLKFAVTCIESVTSLMVTVAVPVPGEVLGGASAGPLRVAKKSKIVAWLVGTGRTTAAMRASVTGFIATTTDDTCRISTSRAVTSWYLYHSHWVPTRAHRANIDVPVAGALAIAGALEGMRDHTNEVVAGFHRERMGGEKESVQLCIC